jgi:hypothetical protein
MTYIYNTLAHCKAERDLCWQGNGGDAKVTHGKFCIQDGLVALVKVQSNESGQNANAASPHRPGMLCKELNSIRELGILTGKLSSVNYRQ